MRAPTPGEGKVPATLSKVHSIQPTNPKSETWQSPRWRLTWLRARNDRLTQTLRECKRVRVFSHRKGQLTQWTVEVFVLLFIIYHLCFQTGKSWFWGFIEPIQNVSLLFDIHLYTTCSDTSGKTNHGNKSIEYNWKKRILCCNEFSVLLLFPYKWSKEVLNTTTVTHPVRTLECLFARACLRMCVFTHAAQLPYNTRGESCRSNKPRAIWHTHRQSIPVTRFHTRHTHNTHSVMETQMCRSWKKGRG